MEAFIKPFQCQTLVRLASALKIKLVVKLLPSTKMLEWENAFFHGRLQCAEQSIKTMILQVTGELSEEESTSAIMTSYLVIWFVLPRESRMGNVNLDQNNIKQEKPLMELEG